METFYSDILKSKMKRVTKALARKLYDNGESIEIQASKTIFDNVWQMPCQISNKIDNVSFDSIINSYKYYNCDKERGLAVHYFVKTK